MDKRVDGIRANTTDAVLALQCGQKKMPMFSRSVVGLSGSGPNTARVNMLDIQVSPARLLRMFGPTDSCMLQVGPNRFTRSRRVREGAQRLSNHGFLEVRWKRAA